MKKTFTILALAAILFTSCKKEETAESAPPEETVADGTAVASDTLTPTAEATTTPQVQPVANGVPAGSVMATQPQTKTTTAAVQYNPNAKGMNPAHGQPGHRCDIAVGAPLNSPPGKANTTTTSAPQTTTQSTTVTPAMLNQNGQLTTPNTTTTVTPAAPTTPVVTAPGMNPPHGQEGHVCSVAVGAPLPKN